MSYWSYNETKLYIRRAEIKGMELKLGFEKSMKVFNTVWGRYLLKGRTEHKGCVAKECMDVLITSNSRIWWGRDTHPRVMGMTKHTTSSTGQKRSTAAYNHIYLERGGEEHRCAHTMSPHKGYTWEQPSAQAVAVGGRLCSIKRTGWAWFRWEDVVDLFE